MREPIKAHVYTIEPGGVVKLVAGEMPFASLPRVGDFLSLSLRGGERSFAVEEVWHTPGAISPLNKLVVASVEAKPPTEK